MQRNSLIHNIVTKIFAEPCTFAYSHNNNQHSDLVEISDEQLGSFKR